MIVKTEPNEMLELTKKVLLNVSFDGKLFRKELSKALSWLNPNELVALKSWCLSKFGATYGKTINEVFGAI